ncbi:unnamed protein product [Ectocarpus fasciculatus]
MLYSSVFRILHLKNTHHQRPATINPPPAHTPYFPAPKRKTTWFESLISPHHTCGSISPPSITPLLAELVLFFTIFPQFSRPIHSHLAYIVIATHGGCFGTQNSWRRFRSTTSCRGVTKSWIFRNGRILLPFPG